MLCYWFSDLTVPVQPPAVNWINQRETWSWVLVVKVSLAQVKECWEGMTGDQILRWCANLEELVSVSEIRTLCSFASNWEFIQAAALPLDMPLKARPMKYGSWFLKTHLLWKEKVRLVWFCLDWKPFFAWKKKTKSLNASKYLRKIILTTIRISTIAQSRDQGLGFSCQPLTLGQAATCGCCLEAHQGAEVSHCLSTKARVSLNFLTDQ